MRKTLGLWLGLTVLTSALPSLWAVNNDGKTDIYWRNYSNGDEVAWVMNGVSYSYTDNFTTDLSDTVWQQVGTGDFNKDGQLDILWRHATSGANAVWLMSGNSYISSAYLQPLSDTNWTVVATGYFDGPTDLNIDILWRNSVTGDNALWFLDSTTLIATALLQEVPDLNWKVGGAGDFNSDGHTDIVWRHSTGVNYVWFMQGANLITTAQLQTESDANWEIVGTGYFSGANDTTMDLLWRHKTSGDNAIWQMNGVSYVSSHSLPWAATSWKVGGTGDSKFDTDADSLADIWERRWWGNLSQVSTGNPDGDSRNNGQEFQTGTDPTVAGGDPRVGVWVDAPQFAWVQGGNAEWHAGGGIAGDQAVSGSITANQNTYIEATVAGSGSLSFWYRFQGILDEDWSYSFLRVYVDGNIRDEYYYDSEYPGYRTGGAWLGSSYGTHVVRLAFIKDQFAPSSGQVEVDLLGWTSSWESGSLSDGVDNTSLTWSTGGNANWIYNLVNGNSIGGGDAAKSGSISSSGQYTYLYTSVTGPGIVSFYWRIDAIGEGLVGKLEFKVDSTVQAQISGYQPWQLVRCNVPSGSHNLYWYYTRLSSEEYEDDSWVDYVRFEPDSDLDGLPDSWESQYFGGTGQNGTGDYDADGSNNLQEYLNGTNPTLAELRVKIASPRWNSLLP